MYTPTRYLQEVGFPESVLDARLTRLSLYKSLINNTNGGPRLEDSTQVPVLPATTSTGPVKTDINCSDLAGIPNGTDTEEHPGAGRREQSPTHPASTEEEPEPGDENMRGEKEGDAPENNAINDIFNFLKEEDSDDEDDDDMDEEDDQPLNPEEAKASYTVSMSCHGLFLLIGSPRGFGEG